MRWAVHWAIGRAAWLLLQTQLAQWINPEWAWSLEQEQTDYVDDDDASILSPHILPLRLYDNEIFFSKVHSTIRVFVKRKVTKCTFT